MVAVHFGEFSSEDIRRVEERWRKTTEAGGERGGPRGRSWPDNPAVGPSTRPAIGGNTLFGQFGRDAAGGRQEGGTAVERGRGAAVAGALAAGARRLLPRPAGPGPAHRTYQGVGQIEVRGTKLLPFLKWRHPL